MATVTGKWTLVHKTQSLQRSSKTLSTLNNRALIFGGELIPRQPRDNDVYILNLSPHCKQPGYKASLQTYGDGFSKIPEHADDIPSARVGTASTVVGGKIYYFSGRGGVNMAPVDGKGQLWQFCFSDAHGGRLLQLISRHLHASLSHSHTFEQASSSHATFVLPRHYKLSTSAVPFFSSPNSSESVDSSPHTTFYFHSIVEWLLPLHLSSMTIGNEPGRCID